MTDLNFASDIAVFVRVVESGSFSAAAEQLEISKSVVSKYVTRLEDALGARLLHRTTRRLGLTEVGRDFYQRCRAGLAEMEAAKEDVTQAQATPRGTLALNIPMSFGILHVAPWMPEFQQRYPDVQVEMTLDDRKVDVIEAGFDASIRIAELPDSSLVARRLGPCRHVIVGSPSYLAQHGSPRTPQDLGTHEVVTYQYQESAAQWQFLDAKGLPLSIAVGGRLRVNNSLALRAAVLHGAGLARVPSFVVGEDIKAGRLVLLLPEYQTPDVAIYLVYPQRRHLAPKVRAFADFMAEKIGREPYWDSFWP